MRKQPQTYGSMRSVRSRMIAHWIRSSSDRSCLLSLLDSPITDGHSSGCELLSSSRGLKYRKEIRCCFNGPGVLLNRRERKMTSRHVKPKIAIPIIRICIAHLPNRIHELHFEKY